MNEPFGKYAQIYSAFLDAGVPLIALGHRGKYCYNETAVLSRLMTLTLIEAAMDWAQLNLGAVTHQVDMPDANPMRFADLDVDRWDPIIDLSPYSIRVRRQGQTTRAHYWFRLRDDVPMKAKKDRRGWEVVTWNTVLPGSTHPDGTSYLLETLVGSEWVEWDGEPFRIEDLPVLNPFDYLPEILPPQHRQGRVVAKHGVPWVKASGTYETRMDKARFYLKRRAWASISGRNGHTALLIVMCNLRLYHGLSQTDAFRLFREVYDSRCRYRSGHHCPWNDEALRHKWDQAGKPKAFPTLGINDPKAQAKAAAMTLRNQVRDYLADATENGGTSNPTELRTAFVAWRDGGDVTATAFGRAVHACTGIRATTSGGPRRYVGFHLRGSGLGSTSFSP
jgi:hypothetical protein